MNYVEDDKESMFSRESETIIKRGSVALSIGKNPTQSISKSDFTESIENFKTASTSIGRPHHDKTPSLRV